MKKFAILCITLLFSSMVSAIPLRFEKGVHYQVVGKVASTKPNVTEFFSFYCGHCFKFEPVAKAIEKNLPQGVQFQKSHVDFIGGRPIKDQQTLTRAFVVSEKMGLGHKVTDAIFEQIHRQNKLLNSEADIRAVFVANGADGAEFDKLMKSFVVKGLAGKMQNVQNDLAKRKILTGVPTFIVNEKYKLIVSALRSQDDFDSLIEFLLNMRD